MNCRNLPGAQRSCGDLAVHAGFIVASLLLCVSIVSCDGEPTESGKVVPIKDVADFGDDVTTNPCAPTCEDGDCDVAGLAEGEICAELTCGRVMECQAGECVLVDDPCNDDNPCTDDICDDGLGCIHVDNDDGELVCGEGACQVKVPMCVKGKLQECPPTEMGEEICDGLDNDCDGEVDEELGEVTCGEGRCEVSVPACVDGVPPECVPDEAAAEPEACNQKDDDCNGIVDDPGAVGCTEYALDADGDGFAADGAETQCLCEPNESYSAVSFGDCDDADSDASPGAEEACDGKDTDCDGETDEADAVDCVPHYGDADGDGHGLDDVVACLCGPSEAYPATVGGDCNDDDGEVFPGAVESCNEKDDDCSGGVDEEGADGCTNYYVDEDKDGYGVTSDTDFHCYCATSEHPVPYTATKKGDCCDKDPNVRPGQNSYFQYPGQCGGFDFNCDGTETKQYTQTGKCDMELVTCSTETGYLGLPAACGESKDWLLDCSYSWGVCEKDTKLRAQSCK